MDRHTVALIAFTIYCGVTHGSIVLQNSTVAANVGRLHQGWAESALDGLLTAVARRTITELPNWYKPTFEACFTKTAQNDIQSKSICLTQAFDRRASKFRSGADRFRRFWRRKPILPTITPIVRRQKRASGVRRLVDTLQPYETFLDASRQSRPTSAGSFELQIPSTEFRAVNLLHAILRGETHQGVGEVNDAKSRRNYHAWQRLSRLMRISNNVPQSQPVPKPSSFFADNHHNASLGHSVLSMMDTFAEIAQQSEMSPLSVLSPKFLSISPNDHNKQKLLSPEVLSFQRDHPGSIPKVLDALKIKHKEEWLQTLMSLTGANDAVASILEWIDHEIDNTTVNEQKRLAMTHLKLVETWANYMDSFSRRQIREMDRFGYTFVENYQLDIFFNDYSPYLKSDKQRFAPIKSRHDRKRALEKEIRLLAKGGRSKLRRHKRQAEAEGADEDGLLDPAMFSPGILSPNVLGHATLSPALFSPSILSPVALEASTLSPGLFNPAILSPSVLVPTILSPFGFSPSILNPEALAPTILSPYMFSPDILVPSVLSPDILTPRLLGGAVLSPCALNPDVLSPSLLEADVLSPCVLSR